MQVIDVLLVVFSLFVGAVPSAFVGRLTGDFFYRRDQTGISDAPQSMTFFSIWAGVVGGLLAIAYIGRVPSPVEAICYALVGEVSFAIAMCLMVVACYWLGKLLLPIIVAGIRILLKIADWLLPSNR